MPTLTPNPNAAAILAAMKPGAALSVKVNDTVMDVKFRSYAPGAANFSYTNAKRQVGWAELRHLVVATDEAVAAPVKAAPVGEFGQRVITALSSYGNPVLASVLAKHMDEPMLKVAGALGNLKKAGLVESHGGENKKGGKTVELTAAGWEYTENGKSAAHGLPEYVDDATVGEVAEPLPTAVFELKKEHVEALERLEHVGNVMDIYTAQLINDVVEALPGVITKTPPTLEDAYYHAALTEEGVAITTTAREVLGMGPKPVDATPGVGKATAARNKAITGQGTRINRKQGAKAGAKTKATKKATKKVADVAREPRATGRAGGARVSLREQVLGVFGEMANGKYGYREVVEALVEVGTFTKAQLQNAAFKLTAAGLLVADADGKTASPLALTEAGKAGYKTKHGGDTLRPTIQQLIDENLSNKDIALRVGCDVAYVHDVRTGRRIGYQKRIREAAAAPVEEALEA